VAELHRVQRGAADAGAPLGEPDDGVPEQQVAPDLRPHGQRVGRAPFGHGGVPVRLDAGAGQAVRSAGLLLVRGVPQDLADRVVQGASSTGTGAGCGEPGPVQKEHSVAVCTDSTGSSGVDSSWSKPRIHRPSSTGPGTSGRS
jgi:hypothetical protein